MLSSKAWTKFHTLDKRRNIMIRYSERQKRVYGLTHEKTRYVIDIIEDLDKEIRKTEQIIRALDKLELYERIKYYEETSYLEYDV